MHGLRIGGNQTLPARNRGFGGAQNAYYCRQGKLVALERRELDITDDSEFKLAARCLTGLWYFWEAPYSWEIPVDTPEGTGTIATWSCLVCWNLRDLSSRFSSTGRTQETR